MLSVFFLILGYIGCFAIAVYIIAIIVKNALIFLFGENINVTYIDIEGNTQKRKVRANNDEDLINVLRELKSNARRKRAI